MDYERSDLSVVCANSNANWWKALFMGWGYIGMGWGDSLTQLGLTMEKLQISTQLLNSIMGYLGTRPYQEVFQLIEAIQKEAKEQPTPESVE